MEDLFSTPVSKTKVKGDIFAYKYPNGTINIDGQKYVFYSVKDAIKKYKKDFLK